MDQFKIGKKESKFRQRGYFCVGCDTVTMVYGHDSSPEVCEDCQAPVVKKWDNIVHSVTTVTPFQE